MEQLDTPKEAATSANAVLQRLAYGARNLLGDDEELFRKYFAHMDLEFADKIGEQMDEREASWT